MDEDTTAPAVPAVDTGASDEPAVVTDETGGVTQDDINAALGPKYKTVAPVTEEPKKDDKPTPKETPEAPADPKPKQPASPEDTKKAEPAKVETSTDTPDFSFTVKDASGASFKISPGDSIEDVLEDFDPKNNGQIISILEQLREAKDKQVAYEADQTKQAKEAETAKTVATTLEGWQSEFKEYKITDNARQEEVMKYMAQANDKREAAGKPLIRTVEDALLGLEKQEAKAEAENKVKEEKETARKNGGLVGGSSAPASGNTAPVYTGSARNATQALRAAGLL